MPGARRLSAAGGREESCQPAWDTLQSLLGRERFLRMQLVEDKISAKSAGCTEVTGREENIFLSAAQTTKQWKCPDPKCKAVDWEYVVFKLLIDCWF